MGVTFEPAETNLRSGITKYSEQQAPVSTPRGLPSLAGTCGAKHGWRLSDHMSTIRPMAVLLLAVAVPLVAAAPPLGSMEPKEVKKVMSETQNRLYSASGYDVTPLAPETVEELAKSLSPEDADIILNKGTEPAFCGNLLDNKKEGTYVCRLCGLPLFSSDAKFTSGTGWPSFFQPFDPAHVRTEQDLSYGMVCDEILCARCGGHLGHVFEDGPKPTGLRFCLNSASLEFVAADEEMPDRSRPIPTETAYFAGGCFWGIEERFQNIPGVIDAASGYQGGRIENPTYQQVCYENTGHAETVRVIFDPSRVSFRDLLEAFFRFHDPTQINRQGPDIGSQYRSAIFCATDEQLAEAKQFIAEQATRERFVGKRIVTQVEPAPVFYEAEDYHQDYYVKNGGSCPIPTYK